MILDAAGSPNDGPKGYNVEVYEPATGWRQVASGEKGSSALVVTFDEVKASKVRVAQTANAASGYWSIHEFYVANIQLSVVEDIITNYSVPVAFYNEELHFAPELVNGNASVEIYNINGQKALSDAITSEVYSLRMLAPGVYVVIVRNTDQEIIPVKISIY